MSLFTKLFVEGAYGVAIRKVGSTTSFKTKYPTIKDWYADPFICSDNGRDYLFVELMDYHIVYGQIAVAPVDNGKIGNFKIIISEPFHMSFPNVFKWRGIWYMIPESYQSGQIRLYRCESFPYKWKFDRTLLKDVQLVDHAIYQKDDKLIVITYDISNLNNKHAREFVIDMNCWKMIEIYPKGNICQDRAAGTVYENNGHRYRAIQDCEKCYGDFLRFYSVDKISDTEIEEHEIRRVHATELKLDENRGVQRTHTYNRNDKYEVIDFWYPKIYPNKFLLRLWKKVIRKDRAHK